MSGAVDLSLALHCELAACTEGCQEPAPSGPPQDLQAIFRAEGDVETSMIGVILILTMGCVAFSLLDKKTVALWKPMNGTAPTLE